MGSGNGSLASPIIVASPNDSTYLYMATNDFNGDGKLDIVLANYSSDTVPVILLGNGDGTMVSYNTPSILDAATVVVGDFNGDGLPGLAFPNLATSSLEPV